VQAFLWTARRGCFEQKHIQIRHLCVIIAKEWIRQQLEVRFGVSAGTSGLGSWHLPRFTLRCAARVFHFFLFVFCVHYIISLTYSISEPATLVSWPLFLSTTNTCYESLILSLLNRKLVYVVLESNLEDTSVSFLHVRALCPILLQLLQRCIAS
jgi:hypothetical protein